MYTYYVNCKLSFVVEITGEYVNDIMHAWIFRATGSGYDVSFFFVSPKENDDWSKLSKALETLLALETSEY